MTAVQPTELSKKVQNCKLLHDATSQIRTEPGSATHANTTTFEICKQCNPSEDHPRQSFCQKRAAISSKLPTAASRKSTLQPELHIRAVKMRACHVTHHAPLGGQKHEDRLLPGDRLPLAVEAAVKVLAPEQLAEGADLRTGVVVVQPWGKKRREDIN